MGFFCGQNDKTMITIFIKMGIYQYEGSE
jgi:hypothetical protein